MAYTSEELQAMRAKGESRTDWEKVDKYAADDSDIPEGFWDEAVMVYPSPKKPISFRVEEDLIEWYKKQAERQDLRGYQSLMHSVLSSYKREQERYNNNHTADQ